MKYTNHALILGVLAVVLIAGCVGQSVAKDCGTDITCFTTAANTCSPAKVTISSENFTMAQEITGTTGTNCGLTVAMTAPIAAQATCSIPMNMTMEGEVSQQIFCQYCTGTMIDLLRSAGQC